MDVITIIPSRLASSRLPNKALADIHGVPMIVHVWRRGMEANLGPVIVACGDEQIADAVRGAGGEAVITDPRLISGSDRVFAALKSIDPGGKYEVIVNLQGDMPTADPAMLTALVAPLCDPDTEIATLASLIATPAERLSDSVVKAAISLQAGGKTGRAVYFSRNTIPWGCGGHYHHIGLYAYKRDALIKFAQLPPGPLEQREKLEQLRALENGMRIDISIVDVNPLGVDTQDDLDTARRLLA
ncbi:3-deoxy-manno-octulosonate cytidylyltransferase [Acerihabitans arboris]|uniref:3-deoxy-manno-octulosonate cytidylyltransferase n=1 Tax=Acerihabitans arboris TaxID=2691583 RepID=A0A845SQH0_9GAMM|nr:3-deoxy-manno-octulosonate cytidylyltransferase [Acerihabitans arboris]NDL63395.1 3-deoxy-manno-octulosonate cytidylyltransferase [Acerihabitans arboris]